MKFENENLILLTREEAYAILCPGHDGCSSYLLDDGISMQYIEREDIKYSEVDWDDIDPDEGFPNEWHAFRLVSEQGELGEQRPYIEGHLKQHGLIKEHKSFTTRYNDVIFGCREYLNNVGLSSNQYGLPRPGVLDLTMCGIELLGSTETKHIKVLAVPFLLQGIIVRTIEGDKSEDSLIGFDALTDEQLVRLCDAIEDTTRNGKHVYRTGLFDKIEDYLQLIEQQKHHYKAGDKIIVQSWYPDEFGQHFPMKPLTATIDKIDDDHVVYTRDDDGCGYSDVLYNILPCDSEKELERHLRVYEYKSEMEQYK